VSWYQNNHQEEASSLLSPSQSSRCGLIDWDITCNHTSETVISRKKRLLRKSLATLEETQHTHLIRNFRAASPISHHLVELIQILHDSEMEVKEIQDSR